MLNLCDAVRTEYPREKCRPGAPAPTRNRLHDGNRRHRASRSVATYRGEPVLELPQDLYIPPDSLEIFLDMFEGAARFAAVPDPQAQSRRADIPMARLTAQYLEYVEIMRQKSLELAGDYLVMAAY